MAERTCPSYRPEGPAVGLLGSSAPRSSLKPTILQEQGESRSEGQEEGKSLSQALTVEARRSS